DVVITQHPQRNWERLQSSHPDHLAVGGATVRAVYPAVENPFAYPALKHLPAFRIHQVWMMAAPAELVNLRLDVAAYALDQLRAMGEHVSQQPDAAVMAEGVGSVLAAQAADERRGVAVLHQVSGNGLITFVGF